MILFSNASSAHHPRRRMAVVSVLIHALGIAALLTIPASEPPHMRFTRATPLASPFRKLAPATLRRSPIKRIEVKPSRVFRPADRLPQPPPLKVSIVLDPPSVQPSIHPADTP